MNKAKILVVEDDKAVRNLITTTLETQNYQYHTAEKGSEALLEAVSFQPDVMLLVLGLPDMDGIAIIEKVRGWSGAHHRHQRPAVKTGTRSTLCGRCRRLSDKALQRGRAAGPPACCAAPRAAGQRTRGRARGGVYQW